MAAGILIITLSLIWSLSLFIYVKSFLGQWILVLPGSSLADTNLIFISDKFYIFLWIVAIGGLYLGYSLVNQNKKIISSENNNNLFDYLFQNVKKCPECANIINVEAIKCKHCGSFFDQEEVKMQIIDNEQKNKLIFDKEFTQVKNQSSEVFCAKCRCVSSANGMYHHITTDTYYHKDCLLKNLSINFSETKPDRHFFRMDSARNHMPQESAEPIATQEPAINTVAGNVAQRVENKVWDTSIDNESNNAASIIMAGQKLTGTDKRKRHWPTYWKRISIGLCVVILSGFGLWNYASQRATQVARDRVDGLIIHYNLRDTVSYESLAASPLGTIILAGVNVKVSPQASVRIESLGISKIQMQGEYPSQMNISTKSINIPLLHFAREGKIDRFFYDKIGLGYTSPTGDADIFIKFAEKNLFTFDIQCKFEHIGSASFQIKLKGLNNKHLDLMAYTNDNSKKENVLAILETSGKLIEIASVLELVGASLSIDSRDLRGRSEEITNQAMPPEPGNQSSHEQLVKEEDLVRKGLSPTEAKATWESLDAWSRKGETIRIETNIQQPIPIFKGLSANPVFNDLTSFIAATKSKVTN